MRDIERQHKNRVCTSEKGERPAFELVGRSYRIPKAHLLTYLIGFAPRSRCPGVTSCIPLLPLYNLMVSAAEVTYSSGCKDRRKHYGSRASARKKRLLLHRSELQGRRRKAKDRGEATGLSVKRKRRKLRLFCWNVGGISWFHWRLVEIRFLDDDILFRTFMPKWLEVTKKAHPNYDYASYRGMVERVIVPLFRKRGIKLVDLKATDLQDFYTASLNGSRQIGDPLPCKHPQGAEVCGKDDPIPTNPADKVERPEEERIEFKGSCQCR